MCVALDGRFNEGDRAMLSLVMSMMDPILEVARRLMAVLMLFSFFAFLYCNSALAYAHAQVYAHC